MTSLIFCYVYLVMDIENKEHNADFYDDLPQAVKDSIETGIKEIEAGELFDHDWVMQEIKNKFGFSSFK